MPDKIEGAVKQYPYRTAEVEDVLLTLPRVPLQVLEEQLAQAAGTKFDNHTVYEIVQDDKPPVYIMFRDSVAIFGLKLKKGNW